MDFDFNAVEIGKKFFPMGCSMCGGEVEFKSYMEAFNRQQDRYVYMCSHCGAYTPAHGETKGEAIKFMPQGILADQPLRSIHDYCRSMFTSLWLVPNGKSAPINTLYPKLVLSFTDEHGDTRYGKVNTLDHEHKTYEMETEDGKIYNVPINLASRIELRTKGHFWLATELGITMRESQIPLFDYERSGKAAEILERVTKSLNIKSKENEGNN